jgi:predicted lipoprotein with Yx(FWY)xxD motif
MVVAAAVALAAGCGSSGSSGSSSTSASGGGAYGGSAYGMTSKPVSAPATAAASTARIGLSHGHLVDAHGWTLYLFEADKTSKSTCSGACADDWPPARTSGKPKAGHGVKASLLGTTKRSDGGTQVTYRGHPLYRYAGDTKRGQTAGEGLEAFGAEWYIVSSAGKKIEEHDS